MIDITVPVEEISAQLIAIPSVIRREKNLCDQLEELLKGYPFCAVQRFHNSLVVRIDNSKESTVAFVGHIDTVPETRANHTIPEFKDGWLWGLGSADMKSGVASLLKIVDDYDNKRLVPQYNTVIVLYESEEGPLPNGMNILLDNNALENIDFAFILEPTECRYSVGCLGALTVKKAVPGISAHSANPRTGKSALLESADIIKAVKEADERIGFDQEIGGYSFYETINVTQLMTENAANVISQKADITINYRFSPKKSVEEAEQYVYDVIGGSDDVYFVDRSPSCYVGDAALSFLRDDVEKEIMQAWTDIAQLNLAGIPAVNFGAGSITVAHKPDERIEIAELRSFYETLITHI